MLLADNQLTTEIEDLVTAFKRAGLPKSHVQHTIERLRDKSDIYQRNKAIRETCIILIKYGKFQILRAEEIIHKLTGLSPSYIRIKRNSHYT